MRNGARALLLAGTLLAAGPAGAQYYPVPPPPPPPPPPPSYAPPPAYQVPAQPASAPPVNLRNNTLRGEFGIAPMTTGFYCYYYYYGYCSSYYSYGVTPFYAALELDIAMGKSGAAALSVGGHVMWGTYNSVDFTLWEPYLDFVLRPGNALSPIRGRLRIGGGFYIGNGTNPAIPVATGTGYGGAFRIGGGISFFNDSPVGLGLDIVFEAGGFRGYYVSTLQMGFGPEFHF
jgi:hypothetical protein